MWRNNFTRVINKVKLKKSIVCGTKVSLIERFQTLSFKFCVLWEKNKNMNSQVKLFRKFVESSSDKQQGSVIGCSQLVQVSLWLAGWLAECAAANWPQSVQRTTATREHIYRQMLATLFKFPIGASSAFYWTLSKAKLAISLLLTLHFSFFFQIV